MKVCDSQWAAGKAALQGRRSGPEQRGGSHCVQGLEDGVVWYVTNLRHMKVCYVERSIVK